MNKIAYNVNFIKHNRQYNTIGVCFTFKQNNTTYITTTYKNAKKKNQFSHKIKCIIGETLYESKRFWNKCIKQHKGQKRNVDYCGNCSNSFVIPKYKISDDELYDLLEIAYWID